MVSRSSSRSESAISAGVGSKLESESEYKMLPACRESRVGEGKKGTEGWDVIEWDIGTCRDATMMIGENRTLRERKRGGNAMLGRRDMWRRQQ